MLFARCLRRRCRNLLANFLSLSIRLFRSPNYFCHFTDSLFRRGYMYSYFMLTHAERLRESEWWR